MLTELVYLKPICQRPLLSLYNLINYYTNYHKMVALDRVKEKYIFWGVTIIEWGMIMVMFFVKFKMFSIIGLFLIPMLIL
jgi:hypothetical protein